MFHLNRSNCFAASSVVNLLVLIVGIQQAIAGNSLLPPTVTYAPNAPNTQSDIACGSKLAIKTLTIKFNRDFLVIVPSSAYIFANGAIGNYPVPISLFKVNMTALMEMAKVDPSMKDKLRALQYRVPREDWYLLGPVMLRKRPDKDRNPKIVRLSPLGMLLVRPGVNLNRSRFVVFGTRFPDMGLRPSASGDGQYSLTASTELPILDEHGEEYQAAITSPSDDPGCKALSPLTRLFLEDGTFSVNAGYSNSSQIGTIGGQPSILSTNASTTYSVGGGYINKPLARELRALLYPADGVQAASQQGTWLEDFFWNAVTVNASIGWGRALAVQDNVSTDSFGNRALYSVSANYSIDWERVWIHAVHEIGQTGDLRGSVIRPADSGYYYDAGAATQDADTPNLNPSDPNFFVNPEQRADWRNLFK